MMGQARANSRPLARYLALINVAAVIAALGVITRQLDPDRRRDGGQPRPAADLRHLRRHRRPAAAASRGAPSCTLALGLGLVVVDRGACSARLLKCDRRPRPTASRSRTAASPTSPTTDYSTVLVALAAGVAAMLSFETRASAAVGVAISVTTIPASAYLGVAIGGGGIEHGARRRSSSSLINVALLIALRQPRPCSRRRGLSAPRRATPGGLGSGDDLDDHGPVARAVVEVDQDELLPGAEREPPADHRHLLGGADQRGALVGVGVGVVVEPVVLVVALDRDQPVEQGPQVGDAAGLELHRRDRGGRPAHEGGDEPVVDRPLGHHPLDVGGDVDDVGITTGREPQFPAVHHRGHASDITPFG